MIETPVIICNKEATSNVKVIMNLPTQRNRFHMHQFYQNSTDVIFINTISGPMLHIN